MDNNTNDLYEVVSYLTSITPPRSQTNIDSLNSVASFIKTKFEHHGLESRFQEYFVGKNIFKNVIGSLNTECKDRIIVGAHYDVCGEIQGADDNASAVAGLLECAKMLSTIKDQLKCRIDFVAYTLEEPPYYSSSCMGSHIHAKSMYDNKINVLAMVNFEMIGYFTDEPKSQRYPLKLMKYLYPSKGNFIGIIGNSESSSLTKIVKKNMQGEIKCIRATIPKKHELITRSDHLNYWKYGFKAIMITDTADFRNPNYHTLGDTIETLNFDMMKKVCNGTVKAIIDIAKSV